MDAAKNSLPSVWDLSRDKCWEGVVIHAAMAGMLARNDPVGLDPSVGIDESSAIWYNLEITPLTNSSCVHFVKFRITLP